MCYNIWIVWRLMYFFLQYCDTLKAMVGRLQTWHILMSHGFRMSCNYLSCRIYATLHMVLLTMSYRLLCEEMTRRDAIISSFNKWDAHHTWWCIMSRRKLLNYSRTCRPEALEMMVSYLGFDTGKAQHEIDDTRGCHARFSFMVDLYEHHLTVTVDADGDDGHVAYHKVCALRSYLLILVDTSIFMDKSATYVDAIYIRNFIDLKRTPEYNRRVSFLVYLYSKLAE